MKITYLTPSIIPSRQANSIQVMKMCQAFARNGHQVYLIVPDRKEKSEPNVTDIFSFYGVEPRFEIIRIPWNPTLPGHLLSCWISAHKAKMLSPDIIYCRDHIAGYFASFGDTPVILESHALDLENGKKNTWFFRHLIQKPTFRKLVVITCALQEYYSTHYPTLSGRIQVASDGADPVSADVRAINFHNTGKRLQVGYVGHLYTGRGIEIIINVAKGCPWADFHIIGGTEEDIYFFKHRIEELSNLIFHGFRSPAEAERYRLFCDVLLAPYQYVLATAGGCNTVQWMSPLKIFEYMAAGKAIIASDIPVLREVLIHEVNCLLCTADNPASWIKALERLDKNDDLRIKLGKNAYQIFLEKYTWKARAKAVLDEIYPISDEYRI